MDYHVWDAVEKDTNHTTCNAKAGLVAKNNEDSKGLLKDTMRNARLWKHLKAVMKVEGD